MGRSHDPLGRPSSAPRCGPSRVGDERTTSQESVPNPNPGFLQGTLLTGLIPLPCPCLRRAHAPLIAERRSRPGRARRRLLAGGAIEQEVPGVHFPQPPGRRKGAPRVVPKHHGERTGMESAGGGTPATLEDRMEFIQSMSASKNRLEHWTQLRDTPSIHRPSWKAILAALAGWRCPRRTPHVHPRSHGRARPSEAVRIGDERSAACGIGLTSW